MFFNFNYFPLAKKPLHLWPFWDSLQHRLIAPKHSKFVTHKHVRHRGVALIWTAIMAMLMILFIGLSLDTGKMALNLNELQNAADAAALAGAQVVKNEPPDDVRYRTHLMGYQNEAEKLNVTFRYQSPNIQPDDSDENYHPNIGLDEPYDIILGRWITYNHTFVATLDSPNAVKAIARRNVALGATAPALRLIFGPVVGTDVQNARKYAVAANFSSGGAGLIVLSDPSDPAEQTLDIAPGSIINIDNGGIHVNSHSVDQQNHTAAWIQGGANGYPYIDAGFINVVGGIDPSPDSDAWADIFANTQVGGYTVLDYTDGVQPIDDPLAAVMLSAPTQYVLPYDDGSPQTGPGARLDLPALLADGLTYDDRPTVKSSQTLGPGYYPNGMLITSGVDVVLQPNPGLGFMGNIFIFGGGTQPNNSSVGVSINGGSLTGHGVTCYATETCDQNGLPMGIIGQIKMTGGAVDIVSPGDWTNQQAIANGEEPDMSLVEGINGIAIWQDPAMPFGNNDYVQLNGGTDFSMAGTIYLPSPIHAALSGNLGNTGNQILCGSVDIAGTAEIHVNYDGRNYGLSTIHCCLVQ